MAPGSIHPLLSYVFLWMPQTPLCTSHSPPTLIQGSWLVVYRVLAPGIQFILDLVVSFDGQITPYPSYLRPLCFQWSSLHFLNAYFWTLFSKDVTLWPLWHI